MKKYQKSDPHTIQNMFGTIASSYDKTNAVLSLGLHRQWNQALVRTLIKDHSPKNILDLCGGTGEIAFTFLKQTQPEKIYLLDFCSEMLQCAQQKSKTLTEQQQHCLNYIQADAQEIPLPDSSVDCVSVAYGIRNVHNPKKCFSEVYRTLRPGGVFGILELTRPSNPFLNFGHNIYLKYFLPTMGSCLTSNRKAYQYLCNSIQAFVDPLDMERQLIETGFIEVKKIPLTGKIATIITAKKPH